MTKLVLVLSGPNLNLLGEREPEVYGPETLADHLAARRGGRRAHDLELEHLQSNHEGDLVDAVHAARGRCAAIVINPGASDPLRLVAARCARRVRRPDRGAAPVEPGVARVVATPVGGGPGGRRHDRRARRPRVPGGHRRGRPDARRRAVGLTVAAAATLDRLPAMDVAGRIPRLRRGAGAASGAGCGDPGHPPHQRPLPHRLHGLGGAAAGAGRRRAGPRDRRPLRGAGR